MANCEDCQGAHVCKHCFHKDPFCRETFAGIRCCRPLAHTGRHEAWNGAMFWGPDGKGEPREPTRKTRTSEQVDCHPCAGLGACAKCRPYTGPRCTCCGHAVTVKHGICPACLPLIARRSASAMEAK